MLTSTMRDARRRYRSACTYAVKVFDNDGVTVIACTRIRRPGCKSFRAWIRAEHDASPMWNASPKLRRVLGMVTT